VTYAGFSNAGGNGDPHRRGVDARGRPRRRSRGAVGRTAGARRGSRRGRGAPHIGRRAARDRRRKGAPDPRAATPPRSPTRPHLGAAQRDTLLGVFTLADTRVDEVMTPRLDMVAVDLPAPSDDVIEAFRQSEHSRLPVYDGTPDNIAGVVFAKDLVPFAMGLGGEDAAAAARWQDLVRPAAFVPETKTLDSQLRDFQRGPGHLAIVVDEFGGTSGLITLEDILEEVV